MWQENIDGLEQEREFYNKLSIKIVIDQKDHLTHCQYRKFT